MCHVFNGYNFSSPGEDGTLKNTFNMKDVLLSQTNRKSSQEGGGKIILKFAVFLYLFDYELTQYHPPNGHKLCLFYRRAGQTQLRQCQKFGRV